MKVTKSSVHRLSIEKACGCKATREYEDVRYTKPLSEAEFQACEKHDKNKAFAEFAGEMLIESLEKEAETAGKTAFVSSGRQVAEGDTGGLVATAEAGGSVQAMGVSMPKRREPRDPLERKNSHMAVAQGGPARPSDTGYTGNLNIAQPLTDEELAEAGITMDGDIEGAPVDASVDAALRKGLDAMGDILDAEDAHEQGVPLHLLRDAE